MTHATFIIFFQLYTAGEYQIFTFIDNLELNDIKKKTERKKFVHLMYNVNYALVKNCALVRSLSFSLQSFYYIFLSNHFIELFQKANKSEWLFTISNFVPKSTYSEID